MKITYKYRIKDATTKKRLRRHAWACNQVWNYCVQIQRESQERWKAGRVAKWLTYFDLSKLTAGTGAELGIHSDTVRFVCRQFVTSRDAKRDKIRFRASSGPKRKLGWVPFGGLVRHSIKVEDNSITYLKQRYRFWDSRPIEGTIKNGAFVEDARGRWYVTFCCEVAEDRPTGAGAIGIDLGLATFATLSDGTKIRHARHTRKHERALATSQRANNRKRTRAIQAKIGNCRKHDLHIETTKLVQQNGLIVVGNVNAASLGKTKMAKSVYDAGSSMFRGMLHYKARRHGAIFIEANERWTSQTCSCCGIIPSSSPKGMGALGVRRWECSECGASHDRDVNAAINILIAGAERRPPVVGITTHKVSEDVNPPIWIDKQKGCVQ